MVDREIVAWGARHIYFRLHSMSLTRPEGEGIKERIIIFQGAGLVVSRGHGIKGYHKGKEIMRIKVSMVPSVTN